ncbi:MAG: hypothetical protein ACK41Q_08080, partial [Candidatus Brocadia sp.]
MALLFSISLLLLMLGASCIYGFASFPLGLGIFSISSLIILCFTFFKVLLVPLVSLLNKEKVALLIEQRYPSLNNSLISSIQLTAAKPRKKT